MAFITKCDNCNTVYEHGFTSQVKKVINRGAIDFTVDIMIRPPHLCSSCFSKIMREVLKKK